MNTWIEAITYLIKSSKFCSFSVMTFDGLAAISHSNFGKHASRILLANASLSFKSICSNFAFEFDFFEMKSSMSLDVGESKINLWTKRRKWTNALSGKHCTRVCFCITAPLVIMRTVRYLEYIARASIFFFDCYYVSRGTWTLLREKNAFPKCLWYTFFVCLFVCLLL